MDWNTIVERVSPYVVQIHTPSGSGTGFLCFYTPDKKFCAIATALHVISHADQWQQPIRLIHYHSGKVIFLKESDRFIFSNGETDSALILFSKREDFPLPEELIPMLPISKPLHIGNEVGWLGFPAIDSNTLCFFSGTISARKQSSYLIDGVAIHGVSGGCVLYVSATDGVQIVGIVSAYRANRVTGETLPGLLYAQDVSYFHGVVDTIRSTEDARQKKQEIEKVMPQPSPSPTPIPENGNTPTEEIPSKR